MKLSVGRQVLIDIQECKIGSEVERSGKNYEAINAHELLVNSGGDFQKNVLFFPYHLGAFSSILLDFGLNEGSHLGILAL